MGRMAQMATMALKIMATMAKNFTYNPLFNKQRSREQPYNRPREPEY